METNSLTLAKLIALWGPGLLFMVGFGYGLYRLGVKLIEIAGGGVAKFVERFLAAQDAQARAVERLAAAMEKTHDEQRDTGVALRALALKIDEMRQYVVPSAASAAAGGK